MSFQAVSWAIKQKMPGTAKLVLIALCNYADHRTGHCWPSAEMIAEEASCSRRSVFTYLGALERNGYIEIQAMARKTGEQRSNSYWVLFDRQDTPWDFNKGANPASNPLDVVDNDENNTQIAPSTAAEDAASQPDDGAICVSGRHPERRICIRANAGFAPPIENLSDSNQSESLPTEESERRPAAMRPAQYDPRARREQQAKIRAADELRKPKMVPVIEGTRAWAAHVRNGHKPTLVTNVIVGGQSKRGWYFPTLFPPNATGPPSADGAEFALVEFEDHETAEAE